MEGILSGLRIVEGTAFVAAPSGGMTLAQLGADVIRFDPIGGSLDIGRWPLTRDGKSLCWAGLNKGKRSIAVNFRDPRGQELLTRLICAPGENAGIFSTNFPARGWLSYESLQAASRRPDHGQPDGTPRRWLGSRLHGQSADRFPAADRSGGLAGTGQSRPAGLGLHHGPDDRAGNPGRRTASAADRPGTTGEDRVERRRAGRAGAFRLDRRSDDQRRGSTQVRQLSVWRVRPRFRNQGRQAGDGRRPDLAAMEVPLQGDRIGG